MARAGGNIRSGGETGADTGAGGVISRPGSDKIMEKDLNLRLGAEIFGQALEAGWMLICSGAAIMIWP